MDSDQDSNAETQPFDTDAVLRQPEILADYFVIDGPEKPKEDAVTFESKAVSHDKEDQREDRPVVVGSKRIDSKTSRSQSIHAASRVKCPPVNCKEKIIICLDLNEEMNTTSFRSRAGDKFTGLELAKRALKMFVMHKSQMNAAHEFAFMIFHEESAMIQNFSSRPQDLLNTLEESEMNTQSSGPLNLSKLFETIQENVELPNAPDNLRVVPPPFIVRLLLIFGRSQSGIVELGKQAQKTLEASPYFFADALYIHEPPSEDNKCEEIFNTLCELDCTGLSYIMEASKYTPIFTSGAKLLAHPLQRPSQEQAAYKIGSLPVVQAIDERCI